MSSTPEAMAEAMSRPQKVYVLRDQAGAVLYVGATVDLVERLRGHRTSSEWFPLVARVTAETYPDRPSALEAELSAIETEHPSMNRIVGPPKPLPPIERTPAPSKLEAETAS